MALLIALLIIAVVLSLRLRIFFSFNNGKTEFYIGLFFFKRPIRRKKSSSGGPSLKKNELYKLLKAVLSAASELRRKIIIEKLKIYCIEADPDPYNAVMKYNVINAAVGSALPFVEKAFNIKKKEIYTDVNTSSAKSKTILELGISLKLFELLHPLLHVGLAVLKILVDRRKVKNYGKQAE